MHPRRALATILLSTSVLLSAAPGLVRADDTTTVSGPVAANPGYMGAQLEPASGGLRVRAVVPGSPADSAGVQAGDVIVQANGGAVASVDAFVRSVRAAGPGAHYALVAMRNGQRVTLDVRLTAPPRQGVAIGQPPPSLSARLVMGSGPADLARLRGRVVIVDFFASWCGPCRTLMPALNNLHRRFNAQGLTVLGVTDEAADVARQVGAEMAIDYTLATEPSAAGRFGVRGLPTTVIIDRRGNVRRVSVGVDGDELRQIDRLVQQLLAEPAP